MTRHHEPHDLRKANNHRAKRERRRAQFRARTQPTRDRVRQEWHAKGWLRSW